MILLALLTVSTRTVKWSVCGQGRGVVTRKGVWSQGKGCGHKGRWMWSQGKGCSHKGMRGCMHSEMKEAYEIYNTLASWFTGDVLSLTSVVLLLGPISSSVSL